MSSAGQVAGRGTATGGIWRAGVIATGIAVAANLGLFLASKAADVSFLVEIGNRRQEIVAASVVLFSAVPMALGTGLAAFAAPRMAHGLRAVQVAGAALAVVSLAPVLLLDAPTATKLALGAMHVVAGAAFVLGLAAARPDR
jgi:hypothetical protein